LFPSVFEVRFAIRNAPRSIAQSREKSTMARLYSEDAATFRNGIRENLAHSRNKRHSNPVTRRKHAREACAQLSRGESSDYP